VVGYLLQLLGIEPSTYQGVAKAAVLGGILLACFAAGISLKDVTQTCGGDLRPKIVGARCLWSGVNPYTFRWKKEKSDWFLDPWQRTSEPSRCTYPPTALLFYSTFAWLPYLAQRLLWATLEWLALFLSFVFLNRTIALSFDKLLFTTLVLYFFVPSELWRFHVERGQFYVFVLLTLSLAIFFSSRANGDSLVAGVFFAFSAALRLPFILIMPPLWIFGLKRTSLAMLGTFVFLVCCTLPLCGIDAWKGFTATASSWDHVALKPSYIDPHRTEPSVPPIAEGVDFRHYIDFDYTDLTFNGAYRRLHLFRFDALPAASTISKVLAGSWLLITMTSALSLRRRGVSLQYILTFAIVTAFSTELFLPHRYDYAEILHLVPLALVIPLVAAAPNSSRLITAFALILAGLGSCFLPSYGVALRAVLLFGGYVLILYHQPKANFRYPGH